MFLRKVGIVKRRTEAARLLREGLVRIDDSPAKPATQVRTGQSIRLEEMRGTRVYEVLAVPEGSVRKSDRGLFARLVREIPREP